MFCERNSNLEKLDDWKNAGTITTQSGSLIVPNSAKEIYLIVHNKWTQTRTIYPKIGVGIGYYEIGDYLAPGNSSSTQFYMEMREEGFYIRADQRSDNETYMNPNVEVFYR